MSKNVLIASASPKLQELISSAFENNGCSVFVVSDADQIIDQLESMSIDLLITDTNLKKINGFKLLKRFREIKKFQKVPGLIMVEATENSLKCRARSAGASGWMSKPPDDKQLQGVIKKLFP